MSVFASRRNKVSSVTVTNRTGDKSGTDGEVRCISMHPDLRSPWMYDEISPASDADLFSILAKSFPEQAAWKGSSTYPKPYHQSFRISGVLYHCYQIRRTVFVVSASCSLRPGFVHAPHILTSVVREGGNACVPWSASRLETKSGARSMVTTTCFCYVDKAAGCVSRLYLGMTLGIGTIFLLAGCPMLMTWGKTGHRLLGRECLLRCVIPNIRSGVKMKQAVLHMCIVVACFLSTPAHGHEERQIEPATIEYKQLPPCAVHHPLTVVNVNSPYH